MVATPEGETLCALDAHITIGLDSLSRIYVSTLAVNPPSELPLTLAYVVQREMLELLDCGQLYGPDEEGRRVYDEMENIIKPSQVEQ